MNMNAFCKFQKQKQKNYARGLRVRVYTQRNDGDGIQILLRRKDRDTRDTLKAGVMLHSNVLLLKDILLGIK